jgi:tRNA threonylcarbamoyl adenosine modification protein (Sua5/YciO/YrdC/YwlC family)
MTTADVTHESRREGGRYSSVSIGLHWLIAVLLITQVILGMRFGDMPRGPGKGEAFATHMSLGITILLLSLARLGWRLSHPAPPLPEHYKAWERYSGAGHARALLRGHDRHAPDRLDHDLRRTSALAGAMGPDPLAQAARGRRARGAGQRLPPSRGVDILDLAGAARRRRAQAPAAGPRRHALAHAAAHSARGEQLTEAEAAAAALRAGGLVILPTETVYGLAADAGDAEAVARIFEAKGRPRFNPLIAHVADAAVAERLAVFDDRARRLAEVFWPGPLTLVLPFRGGADVSDLARAGLDTVAVRVPAHPVAGAVLAAFGGPVVAPSANRSGRPSPTTFADAIEETGSAAALAVDGGPCAVGLESTVVALLDGAPRLLRPGAVTRRSWGP